MAGRTTVTTEQSFNAAAQRITDAAQRLEATVPHALRLIAEEIMTDVKASRPGAGVPRDTGRLANSGMVTEISPTLVELSFGDDTVNYALVQHERLDYHHTLGEARYLVRGIERWQPGGSAALQALAENMQAAFTAAGR